MEEPDNCPWWAALLMSLTLMSTFIIYAFWG